MATAPAVDKPSVVKELESPQIPLKGDLSYLDKLRKDPKKPDSTKKELYWFGALPALGKTPTGKTALEDWNRESGLSIWAGKCPWFQDIAIRDITFPAFTGTSQRSPVQSPNQPIANGITMAGFVAEFTEEEIKNIIFQADHHMIRPPQGNMAAMIYRLVEIGGEWVHESQDPAFQTPIRYKYNPDIDRPVSDFVYLVKIKDRFQQHDVPSLMRNPQPSLSGR